MPTYQYKCSDCETILTVVRGISEEDPGYECATCKIALKKVYLIGNPVFRGSGFYSKDK